MKIKPEDRYSTLVKLWIYQSRILYQWPALVLTAIFVAVPKLLNDAINITNWCTDRKLQFGTSLPLLVISIGTLIMTYTMRRHQKILQKLEEELKILDHILYHSMHLHTGGTRGSMLLEKFLTIIGLLLLLPGLILFLFALLSLTRISWLSQVICNKL